MKRITQPVLVMVLLLSGLPSAFCQTATPEGALEELVTTNKIEVAVRHLPVDAAPLVDSLSPQDKQEFAQRILPVEWLKRQGLTLQKSDNGEWSVLLRSKREVERISIIDSAVSGDEALVRLRCHIGPVCRASQMLVSMRLQDDDWRVISFGNWQPKNIESPEYLRRLTPMGKNEAAAVEAIEEIRGAIYEYSRQHPEIGLPANLQALAAPGDHADDEQSQPTGDSSWLATPFVKDGYEFHYTMISSGAGDAPSVFRITAAPVQFGKTGERSFYTDETWRIHFTSSGRPADANDPELDQTGAEPEGPSITIQTPCINGP